MIIDRGSGTKLSEQLAQIATQATSFGVDNKGVNNCSTLINQLITNNPNGRIYFPDGTYNIDQTINITNYCSLELSPNAVFKCVAAMDKMVYVNRNSGEGLKQFIKGGTFDGNGLANNGVYVDNTSQWMFFNSVVKNCLLVNVYPHGGYEIYMENIRIDNTLTYSVNPNVVGIHAACTDSVFRNIIVKNCTTGAIDDGSNSWYDLHPWGNDINRIPTSIGFTANSEVHLIKYVADTCAFGVTFGGGYNVYFKDCTFMFNNTYLTQLPSLTPVFISNASNGTAYLYQCRLSSYGNNITIANSMTRCFLYNCTFSSPFNTTTTGYVNIQQVGTNFYRVTLNSFTINANTYTRLQIPLTGLNYNDFFFLTVVNDSSQSTYYKSYATNGFINLLYFNTTASAVTYNNLLVNLAVIPNSNFPITTSTF
jgi:hypothetical protein